VSFAVRDRQGVFTEPAREATFTFATRPTATGTRRRRMNSATSSARGDDHRSSQSQVAILERVGMHIYYSPSYTAAAHEFDTTRKATWIAESLIDDPIAGVTLVEPTPLTDAQLREVHSTEYVEAVRTGSPRHLAESSSFRWDPAVWDAVRASNGGAVAAALHSLDTRENSGSLSSGLHHARRERGSGFCTFNGLALAARAAIDAGAERLLILDLDAHVGDGTVDIVHDWPEVLHVDLAVSAWDAPAGDQGRCSVETIHRAEDYLPTLERRLASLTRTPIDLCIYNAGMDPHEDSDIGGLAGMTTAIIRARERTVFEWAAAARIPVAFVLAGGYAGSELSRERLVDLHRLTIAAAVSTSRHSSDAPAS
jgi:acetoin utilization deacetylase AcuC-like enzyme